MIIISSRQDFNDPDTLSINGHHIKDIDLDNDSISNNMGIAALLDKIRNKKVLMLVHGYNNEQLEVYDAYQIINKNIDRILPTEYDYIIGYSWPGGNHGRDWWGAKSRSNSVARLFRTLLETLANSTLHLDLMSHS